MGAVQGMLLRLDDTYFKKIYMPFSKFQSVGVITNLTDVPTSVELKLFMALIQFRGQPDIEMTILHVTQQKAQLEVIDILEQDGYKMGDTINLVVREIDGPFRAGFVISRNRIRN